nr:hypothetical protein [Tanacetum cinerariifolium]
MSPGKSKPEKFPLRFTLKFLVGIKQHYPGDIDHSLATNVTGESVVTCSPFSLVYEGFGGAKELISVGENFSHGRAKGYSIASVMVLGGVEESEKVDENVELAKVKEFIKSELVHYLARLISNNGCLF